MAEDPTEYLRPEIASGLGSMELVAKFVVEGFITGLHKSPYHGFSVEFAEHRPYLPGDAIRNIDWKLFARTDRHYIKQFEEETNLKAHIIVDASRSMNYTSDPKRITKYKYATMLAAALAYLLMRQQDAVGLGIFDEELRTFMPARLKQSYLREMLRVLQTTEPSHTTRTELALRRVAERLKRRGLVIVISDFLDDPAEIKLPLSLMQHAGHEVIAFQVLDPAELTLELHSSDATIVDLETGEQVRTQPYQLQASYQRSVAEYLSSLKDSLLAEGIDYLMLETTTPFDRALLEYLHKRQQMG
ncbi:MAG TPA: DUF58 domain-containing protein [Candidatus Kapabacteria bacterium]|jgi:uncharacterized protein (DUF58 family)|nr:DUF58 domain-containing protein [Candidatus Kapabacteria bacterium]